MELGMMNVECGMVGVGRGSKMNVECGIVGVGSDLMISEHSSFQIPNSTFSLQTGTGAKKT